MSADRESPAPIEDVVAEFFRAQGEASLADEMRRAVLGKRVILLVDGLDEASDAAAAQTLTAILTAFVDRNNIPVVASSRPHVARNLTIGSWDRSTLAPLSDAQRHALADLWFGLLERFEGGPGTPPAQVAARARRKADRFANSLRINAGIARLSQIPLFLLAFLSLHRRGHGLPRNRFAASQEIVAQLMEHQPRRREISVLATRSLSGEPRLRNRVIADFAFALQTGDLQGSMPDAAAEDRAVARAAALIRERQQNADQETADSAARAIFSFTEERAGLLVNKAPSNIGFLHLSLQEFLAARHLMQRPPAERLSFVSAHAGKARWREPILYLLFLTENEVEVGQLLEAISAAPVADAAERVTRDALAADAVFADLAHDLGTVRRLAAALFAEIEGAAWGERRRHLLNGVVDGLLSESLGAMCREKLSEWVPDRYGPGRASAIEAIPTWVADARQSSIPALLRCLRSENEYVWRKAAETLAIVAKGSDDVKERLSRLARAAPSVQTAQAVIATLGCGWWRDEDVGALASAFRSHGHSGICLDAIRIRARRGETDGTDLDRYFSMAYGPDHYATSRSTRDLVEHFAVRHRTEFVERLEAALRGLMGDRIHRTLPFLASLFICDSDNALAHQELLQALQHDWVLHDIFVQEHFPVERVAWTPPLIAKLEQHINAKERFIENDLYWISKLAPLPVLKQKFLESLRGRPHLGFWCSRALAEVWGKSDPDVQSLFTWMLTAKPETIAQAAAEMPLMLDDRTACREALLRALRASVTRYDFILKGCKTLGITTDDTEMVQAALHAGTRKMAPLYRDAWREGIIEAFAPDPQVRQIALDELAKRGGRIGTVANNYPHDRYICQRVLNVLCPLDDSARMTLVQNIEAIAPSNSTALELLRSARQDKDGLVCGESVIGWVEAALTTGPLEEGDIQWLVTELTAVGSEYQKRRIAAVIGLLLSGNLGRFVQAKRYDDKPLDVEVRPDLTRDDMYLRRLLPHWRELTRSLGGEGEVLDRLGIDAERTLTLMRADIPNAGRLFDLLMEQVPTARYVYNNDLIAALAEMAPRSRATRDLVASLLLGRSGRGTRADHWAELRAGDVFAEYFRDDIELRRQVIDAFRENPENSAAAGALAELLLRENDASVGELLSEGVAGRGYPIGAHYKLMFALAAHEDVIHSMEELLEKTIDPDEWSLSYWVPTLLRRIKLDHELQEKMYLVLSTTQSVSLKVSLSTLLSRGAGQTDKLRQHAAEELARIEADSIPAIGFDLANYAHRPLFQALTEILA